MVRVGSLLPTQQEGGYLTTYVPTYPIQREGATGATYSQEAGEGNYTTECRTVFGVEVRHSALSKCITDDIRMAPWSAGMLDSLPYEWH